jgi:hypothetical protein
MQNHKDIHLNYNPNELVDILQGYPVPPVECVDVTGCKPNEVKKISEVLNLGVPIRSILYFRMGINFQGLIHKDANLNAPSMIIDYGLNLPLLNCDEVYMKWFTQKDLNVNISQFDGPSIKSPTPKLDRHDSTCIDTVLCNTTKLVKVNDWHAIENQSMNKCAYLISIRFAFHVKPSMDLPISEW